MMQRNAKGEALSPKEQLKKYIMEADKAALDELRKAIEKAIRDNATEGNGR